MKHRQHWLTRLIATTCAALILATPVFAGDMNIDGRLTVSSSMDGSDTALVLKTTDPSMSAAQEIRLDFDQTTTLGRIASYFNGANKWGLKFYGYTSAEGINTVPTLELTGDQNAIFGVGNVGIGGDPSTYRLSVAYTGNNGLRLDDGTRQIYLGTTGGEAAVGTLTNHQLGLMTNGANRLTIDSSGKVGIGCIASENLSVFGKGSVDPQDPGEPGVLSLESIRQDAGSVDVGRISGKNTGIEIARIGMPRAGGSYTGFLTFHTKADNATALAERMRIDAAGNVGIGTTSPSAKLHIVNSGEVLRLESSGGQGRYLRFNDSSNTKHNFIVGVQQNVDDGFEITPSTTAGGSTFSTPAFVVRNDGNVGIGCTPSTQLTVQGSSSGIRVQGYSAEGSGSNAHRLNGQIEFGSSDSYRGRISYNGAKSGEEHMYFVNTYDSAAAGFRFLTRTAGTPVTAMAIDGSGNVGIGCIPSVPLHLTSSAPEIRLNATSDALVNLRVYGSDNTERGKIAWDSGKNMLFETAGSERMRISSAGNVLIGTSGDSGRKLQVESTGAPVAFFKSTHADGPGVILANATTSIGYLGSQKYVTGGGNADDLTIKATGNLRFYTDGGSEVYFHSDRVHAREIVVEDVAADFVFADDYKLPSLDEVEKHIKSKRHLPGIAPASVTKKGVGVSDQLTKHLQKIEELTLYTLQQQKELEESRRKNAELEKRLERLEKLLRR